MSSSRRKLAHNDYTVSWISALPLEMAAAMAMLDDSHAPLPQRQGDHNSYHLGEIGNHNIVIACLPAGVYGLTSAAVVAKQMSLAFPRLETKLMVGIGGGAPSPSADGRLGDIVVSMPTDRFPGVIQYDYGKALENNEFYRTGSLNKPPEALLTAVSNLQAKHMVGNNNIHHHLEDILFDPSYPHQNDDTTTCERCDKTKAAARPTRANTEPIVHYGLIASANQVMKTAQSRDHLQKELGVLCFEMEAAGLMDHFSCLVIRGICDYSDSHKNKQWQQYAASTAAAYTRCPICRPSQTRICNHNLD
ncbi:hypothetical protein BDV12DRAFT_210060 [Aspergillus spectabilis]